MQFLFLQLLSPHLFPHRFLKEYLFYFLFESQYCSEIQRKPIILLSEQLSYTISHNTHILWAGRSASFLKIETHAARVGKKIYLNIIAISSDFCRFNSQTRFSETVTNSFQSECKRFSIYMNAKSFSENNFPWSNISWHRLRIKQFYYQRI